MNSGSFFRLDLDSSKVVDGITCFEYVDLPDLEVSDDGLTYPIRLTVTQERVSFFVHYYNGDIIPSHTEEVILDLPYKETNIEALASTIKRVYNTDFPISPYLLKVLEWRYGSKDSENEEELREKIKLNKEEYADLEKKLHILEKRMHVKRKCGRELREKIKLNKEEYADLEKKLHILEKRMHIKRKCGRELREKIKLNKEECSGLERKKEIIKKYKYLKKSPINKDSYSSLSLWGLVDKQDDGSFVYKYKIVEDNQNNEQSKEDDKKSEKITKFLRKLLLDFMFDLIHSDVFQCSKYYSQMREGLMNDFFFSSIVKKSEYYYNRRLVKNRLSSIIESVENSKDLIDVVKEIREKNKKRKRRIWWNQLFWPNNTEIFNTINVEYEAEVESVGSNKCYSRQAYDTVRSIKNLYAEKLDEAESEWIDVIMSPLADKHFSISPEWYEDIIPRKKSSQFQISESWFVNSEEEMSRIVFPLKDNSKKMHYMNSFELCSLTNSGDNSSVIKRNTKISKWFFRRFDFVDTFRIHFFKHWNHFFASLLLCFSVVAVFPNFWLSPRNIALFPALVAVVCFVSFVIHISISYGKNVQTIDELLVRIRRKREGWRSFCFSLLFVSIWIFLYFYDWLSFHWIGVLIKVLSLLGIAVILLYFVKPRVHIIDNIHLFLPRLVASITAAWIMLVIGNDLVKERLSWPTWIILSVVVFAFILYESNKYLPNISTGARVWRALELMLISFSLSLVIGVFAIDVLSPSLREYASENNIKYIDWLFLTGESELTITIIHKYLVQFSFLAMFIGVFIQMIFEEKNITEM